MLIILTILIITVVIVVHEFGHYITAIKFNVKVDEFSIGMGPKIYSKGIFSIRLLPIGGYVRMDDESFAKTNNYKKIVIMLAGIFMNFLLAFLIILVMYNFNFINSLKIFANIFALTIEGLKSLFIGKAKLNELVGPIGIPKILQNFSNTLGYIKAVNYLTLLISINLGIMNFLPIPGLDGSRVLITLLKMLGLNISKEKEQFIYLTGAIILIIITILVTKNDIFRYIGG